MTLAELVQLLTVERFAPSPRPQSTVAEVYQAPVTDWCDDELAQARRRRILEQIDEPATWPLTAAGVEAV